VGRVHQLSQTVVVIKPPAPITQNQVAAPIASDDDEEDESSTHLERRPPQTSIDYVVASAFIGWGCEAANIQVNYAILHKATQVFRYDLGLSVI
jgi:hypothetical protein